MSWWMLIHLFATLCWLIINFLFWSNSSNSDSLLKTYWIICFSEKPRTTDDRLPACKVACRNDVDFCNYRHETDVDRRPHSVERCPPANSADFLDPFQKQLGSISCSTTVPLPYSIVIQKLQRRSNKSISTRARTLFCRWHLGTFSKQAWIRSHILQWGKRRGIGFWRPKMLSCLKLWSGERISKRWAQVLGNIVWFIFIPNLYKTGTMLGLIMARIKPLLLDSIDECCWNPSPSCMCAILPDPLSDWLDGQEITGKFQRDTVITAFWLSYVDLFEGTS